jgi:hypothetical protein
VKEGIGRLLPAGFRMENVFYINVQFTKREISSADCSSKSKRLTI